MPPSLETLSAQAAELERALRFSDVFGFLASIAGGLLLALLLLSLIDVFYGSPPPLLGTDFFYPFLLGASISAIPPILHLRKACRPSHERLCCLLQGAHPLASRYDPRLPTPPWQGDALWIPVDGTVSTPGSAHVRLALAEGLSAMADFALADIRGLRLGLSRPALAQVGAWIFLLDLDAPDPIVAISHRLAATDGHGAGIDDPNRQGTTLPSP